MGNQKWVVMMMGIYEPSPHSLLTKGQLVSSLQVINHIWEGMTGGNMSKTLKNSGGGMYSPGMSLGTKKEIWKQQSK